jgi:hypothetical protein
MGKKDAKAKKEETPESLPEDLVITPDELLFQRKRALAEDDRRQTMALDFLFFP